MASRQANVPRAGGLAAAARWCCSYAAMFFEAKTPKPTTTHTDTANAIHFIHLHAEHARPLLRLLLRASMARLSRLSTGPDTTRGAASSRRLYGPRPDEDGRLGGAEWRWRRYRAVSSMTAARLFGRQRCVLELTPPPACTLTTEEQGKCLRRSGTYCVCASRMSVWMERVGEGGIWSFCYV